MADCIVIASGKGGVGKSTLAAGLGRASAAAGKKTLLIDCDPGLGSLDILFGCAEDSVFTWLDILTQTCSAEDALLETGKNLFLLPAPRALTGSPQQDSIETLLRTYNDSYDRIFIDAPAGIGDGLLRAACGAQKALVVATPDAVSVRGAWVAARKLEELGVGQTRLVVNRFHYRAARKGKLFGIDTSIDKTAVQLIGVVPEDDFLLFSSVTGNKQKDKSPATAAFRRIERRIGGENIPLKISYLK